MPKEKNYNPVQAAKKAEKAKTLKKQKAQLQTQRTEKLARRNPSRIQRDIDALKDAEQTGALRPHERTRLNELEKDLAAVNKARTALGEKAPQFKPEREQRDQRDGGGGRGGRGGVLGKRSRDGGRRGHGHGNGEDSSDTDADVRRIPMPRDTPPPIPKRYWGDAPQEEKKPTLVYEAAPQVRDFKKEVTSRFMPAAVAQKLKLAKGEGRLLEPDEFDKLQQEGYMNTAREGEEKAEATKAKSEAEVDPELERFLRAQEVEDAAENAAEAAVQEAEYEMMAAENRGKIRNLEGESRVAENKLRHVEIEDVEDGGDY
ncbi:hypothetical protein PMIN03_001821 [Paraphaeosphaeria minitans]|uniref:WW domain binding protein 11 n=1 Tax=Paraphaeosphaeria minitans TaxID=565426 RepID=A0A9P6GN16_9PLEO|nr:WW domain binding protein 11 [Paraphaeosphaeria minitans]